MNKDSKLAKLLGGVRSVQQFFAIMAELLILIAFFVSGMDVGMGGIMADMPVMKWGWALVFSLGLDTSFVISWVRVRQTGKSWHQVWCIPVAVCISVVVFQPVAIQLLQQSVNISFNQALSYLGIDIVELVYARAFVAVCLGAILALTNVESKHVEASVRPKRTFLPWKKLVDKYAPVDEVVATPLAITEQAPKQPRPTGKKKATHSKVIAISSKQEKQPLERVREVLSKDPLASLTIIAQRAEVSRGYASQLRQQIANEQPQELVHSNGHIAGGN
jgi:hypothetical protein